ncbi:MAG: NUDIX domain-containing protein [Micrococcales bacterium]|nr:NUDIX domain-containing protein [Micrococcales bacterium]
MTARDDAADSPTPPLDPGFGRLRDRAVDLLAGWDAPEAGQDALRADYLAHLEQHPGACAKAGPPEHLTAGALVVNAAFTRTALVLHGKGRRWFQPGGHLEGSDADLASAALREAQEETGLLELRLDPVPLRLDRHRLEAAFGRCREHLDVQFLAVTDGVCAVRGSAESDAVRWWPLDALPDDLAVGSLVEAARARLRAGEPR